MKKKNTTVSKNIIDSEDDIIAIRINKVSKKFVKRNKKMSDSLLLRTKKNIEFKSLDNISFSVNIGECIGFIGLNGSGKSTLSNIIAGHLLESSGVIKRNGTASLLAINSGMKPNLTGIDNIKLKLLLLGFKPSEISSRIEKIIDFTELQEFINQPLKEYSSGMRARLGFGIAIQSSPDILIIDEALAVGDQTFYNKCLYEIKKLEKSGKTIFFVSHSISQIRDICNSVAWLHYGKLKMFGDAEEVCLEYSKFIYHFNKKTNLERSSYQQRMIAKQLCIKEKKLPNKKEKFNLAFFFLFVSLIFLMFFNAWKIITT